jgi:predicted ATPase
MQRHIVTGAPGVGKTSIVDALAIQGYDVVPEAATAVIAEQQALGVAEPWSRPEFIDQITQLQVRGCLEAKGDDVIFDRSPICTLALARYLGHPESSLLRNEVARICRQGTYAREVFFVRPIGFVEPTAARRIGYADSLDFERFHEDAYRGLGYVLIEIPDASLAERVRLIRRHLPPRRQTSSLSTI